MKKQLLQPAGVFLLVLSILFVIGSCNLNGSGNNNSNGNGDGNGGDLPSPEFDRPSRVSVSIKEKPGTDDDMLVEGYDITLAIITPLSSAPDSVIFTNWADNPSDDVAEPPVGKIKITRWSKKDDDYHFKGEYDSDPGWIVASDAYSVNIAVWQGGTKQALSFVTVNIE